MKELADQIVDLGILEIDPRIPDMVRLPGRPETKMWPADALIDWRVAGALMDWCRDREYLINSMHDGYVYIFTGDDREYTVSESTDWPLAFTEACVAALQEGS